MAVETTKKLRMVLCLMVLLNLYVNGAKAGTPQVPCMFVFGDSLVDAGNNNNLNTLARADFPPYGCDFAGGFTGRFTNGRTTVDFLTEFMGFDRLIPPSRQARDEDIIHGVNFASAAGGIRNETGSHLGQRLCMSDQVKNFTAMVPEFTKLFRGKDKASAHLRRCIYFVALGSNDYLNNYFMPQNYPATSKNYSPVQYANELVNEYTTNLMAIYALGGRKFVLNGVGEIGCTPGNLAHGDGKTCAKNVNDAIQLFNMRLKSQVDYLNKNHPDARFTYVNTYSMFQEIMTKSAYYGFKNTNEACCGVGKNKAQVTCYPYAPPCSNRNQYIWWDSFHPTETTNLLGASKTYATNSTWDAHPYDVQTIANIKI